MKHNSDRKNRCPNDKRAYCDDIESWQCYTSEVRSDCCHTCQPHEGHKPGCEFGDRQAGCNTTEGKDCYQLNHRDQCCRTCDDFYTGINGCEYGDRIQSCDQDMCGTYSSQKRNVYCCETCGPPPSTPHTGPHTTGPTAPTAVTAATPSTSTWTVMHTTWSEKPTTGSSILSSSSSTTSAARKGNNTGVAVGVSVSVVFVVVVIIIAVVCWRRKRNSEPKHLSPITDVMYNEYKLSKRAPLPEPRDISKSKTGSKQKLVRQDSDVYAYINPDDVEHIPAKTDQQNGIKKQARNEDDPLPPTPGDYLELKVVDNYGYMEPVEKNKNQPNPYSEPYSDNTTAGYINTNGIPEYKKISSVRAGQDTSHQKF